MAAKLFEIKELRNKKFVFEDRVDAAQWLARILLPRYDKASDTVVFGIPSGGVPVAVEIVEALNLPFDLIIVRKIPVPGNTEAGFGAVTLDGRVIINQDLVTYLHLSPDVIERQIASVRAELEERNHIFRQDRPLPDMSGKTAILVDDGLASGFTMLACVETVERLGASKKVVAAPTASEAALGRIGKRVDEIFCPNIRTGPYYAVAEAYRHWHDLNRQEVLSLLESAGFIQ